MRILVSIRSLTPPPVSVHPCSLSLSFPLSVRVSLSLSLSLSLFSSVCVCVSLAPPPSLCVSLCVSLSVCLSVSVIPVLDGHRFFIVFEKRRSGVMWLVLANTVEQPDPDPHGMSSQWWLSTHEWGFVWKFFYALYLNFHSFIHSFIQQ